MPNRIIKESIRMSDSLAGVSADAERLFWRIIVSADDFGRFDARPSIVLGQCLSSFLTVFTSEQVQSWLVELQEADLIRLYQVEGRPYLVFTKWDSHQQRRAKASKFPPPDSDCNQMQSNDCSNVFENVFENENVNDSGGGVPDAKVEINNFYEMTFGRFPNDVQRDELFHFTQLGMQIELVRQAMHKARVKGKDLGYAMGILETQYDRGIRTLAQAEIDDAEHQTAVGSEVNARYSIHNRASPAEGNKRSITGGKVGKV